MISFWKINENYNLEGFHINFEDLANQIVVRKYITGLALTPFFNQILTYYAILSTNKGNIMIVDKEKKACLRNIL